MQHLGMIRGTWAVLTLAMCLTGGEAAERPDPDRWAEAMAAFAALDEKDPPAKGGILFVGSSSIRLWDTGRFFPQRKDELIKRGFGGCWLQDVRHHAGKIVFPYAPRTIVVYAGDNDISGGLDAKEVMADYESFADEVRTRLPETDLLYIAIKPSVQRWNLWPEMQRANELIAERCRQQPRERFVDIAPLLLGEDGRPQPGLFVEDGLHLSEGGYRAWSALLEKALTESDGQKSAETGENTGEPSTR